MSELHERSDMEKLINKQAKAWNEKLKLNPWLATVRESELYKNMDYIRAGFIAEGVGEGENATAQEKAVAWQFIWDTGMWKKMPGFYGRTVHWLIDEGLVDPVIPENDK